MSDKRSGQGLTGDTRPLATELLSAEQSQYIEGLRQLIEAMVADGRSSKARAIEQGWRIELDPRPTYRAVLIDAGRGAGKTSLMLTLLQQLDQEPKPTSVLVLQPVDFDPMPAQQTPYTSLVLAFRPICDRLEAVAPGPRWLDASPTDDRGAYAAPLRDKWRDLYRKALTGWSGFAGAAAMRDIDDFIDDHESAGRGWCDIRAAWRDFVDALLARCKAVGWLSDGGSLLLPIDDLDLTPHCALDLTQALRHLRHPRLITLITGDSAHLERVLARQMLIREAGGGSAAKEEIIEARRDARALARAYLDKAIPRGMRQPPPEFSAQDAFRMAAQCWQAGTSTGWGLVSDAAVQQWLAVACEGIENAAVEGSESSRYLRLQEGFRIRDLAHALDAVEWVARSDSTAKALLRGLLAVFRVHVAGRLSEKPYPEDLEDEFAGLEAELRPVDLEFGEHLGIARQVTVVLVGPGSPQALGRLGLLRLSFHLDDHLFASRWRATAWSRLVFHMPDELPNVRLGWPTRTPMSWTWRGGGDRLRRLRKLAGGVETERLVAAWLVVHCEWFVGSAAAVADHRLVGDEPIDLAASLRIALTQAASCLPWRMWLTRRFPVICAPGYGLSYVIKQQIFAALSTLASSQGEWDEWRRQWGELYKEALGAAEGGSVDEWTFSGRVDRDRDPWGFAGLFYGDKSWFDLPTHSQGGVRRLLDSSVRSDSALPQLPSWLLGLRLPDDFHPSPGRDRLTPHWGTRQLQDLLPDSHQWAFVRLFDEICGSNRERPLRCFIEGWRELAEWCGQRAVYDWFRIEPDETNLIWQGPERVQLQPKLGDSVTCGSLVVRPLIGWEVEGRDLPPALVGWLGVMQTLGIIQHRPDGRFEGWVSLPQGLATMGSDEWTFPPLTSWLEVEGFAALWNKAVETVAKDPHETQADITYLTLRWLWATLLAPCGGAVSFTQGNEFGLRARHFNEVNLSAVADRIAGSAREPRPGRLLSWSDQLQAHEPAVRVRRTEPVPAAKSTSDAQRIGTLPEDADEWFGRSDVTARLQAMADAAEQPRDAAGVIAWLGDLASVDVTRRVRDYFTAR